MFKNKVLRKAGPKRRKVREADGRGIAEAVSRRPLTAETWVRLWIGPCGICGRLSGAGTGFLSSAVFPVSFIPPWRHTHMRMNSRHVGGRSSERHRTSKSTVFCCRTDAVLPYSSEKSCYQK